MFSKSLATSCHSDLDISRRLVLTFLYHCHRLKDLAISLLICTSLPAPKYSPHSQCFIEAKIWKSAQQAIKHFHREVISCNYIMPDNNTPLRMATNSAVLVFILVCNNQAAKIGKGLVNAMDMYSSRIVHILLKD